MWKDTGIAMFTLVRQAELSQDWSYFPLNAAQRGARRELPESQAG